MSARVVTSSVVMSTIPTGIYNRRARMTSATTLGVWGLMAASAVTTVSTIPTALREQIGKI